MTNAKTKVARKLEGKKNNEEKASHGLDGGGKEEKVVVCLEGFKA